MSANPVIRDYAETVAETQGEPRLSPDENWELIFRMFGSGKQMFAEFGGSEAFLRAERKAWDSDESEPEPA